MKNKIMLLVMSMMLILSIATPAFAESINAFTFNSEESVENTDDISGCLALAGKEVRTSGIIDGIAFLAGEKVDVEGESAFPVAMAKEINLNGKVAKDFFALAAEIDIDEKAVVERDAFICGGDVTISGTINRDIYVTCEKLKIGKNAKINGNVFAETSLINIEEGATVAGTLKYNEDANNNVAEDKFNVETYATKNDETTKKNSVLDGTFELAGKIIGYVLVFVFLMLLCGAGFSKTKEKLNNGTSALVAFLVGCAAVIVIPIAAIILMITGVGVSLGLILLALYFIIMYIAFIFVAYYLADLCIEKFFKKELNKYLIGIIGIVILSLITLIPFVNIFITLFGYGMIVMICVEK